MSKKYTPTNWVANKTVATADAMNNIEKGIEDAHQDIEILDSQVKDIVTLVRDRKPNETDDTTRLQEALDNGTTIKIPAGTYYASNLIINSCGQKIYGDGEKTIIINNSNNNLFESDPKITRLYNITIENIKIIQPNMSNSTAIKLNNPNRCGINNVIITTNPSEKTNGTGIHIVKNDKNYDGYFVSINNCVIEKQNTGIKIEGQNPGFTNVHWLKGNTVTNNEKGISLVNCGSVEIIDNHIEINKTGILNTNSASTVIKGNYFERQSDYDVDVVSGDYVMINGENRFGATANNNSNGRAIIVRNGDFNSIQSNAFIDRFTSFDIEIQENANNTTIFDNVSKTRTGWNNGGVQVKDNSITTITRNPLLTAGGTTMCEYKGKHVFKELVTIDALSPMNTSSKIYSGNVNPEGNVTANIGSIYMRTNGGLGYSVYVKETSGVNTGWTQLITESILLSKVFKGGYSSSRPNSPVVGQTYFDSTLGKLIVWNGNSWKNADGTSINE